MKSRTVVAGKVVNGGLQDLMNLRDITENTLGPSHSDVDFAIVHSVAVIILHYISKDTLLQTYNTTLLRTFSNFSYISILENCAQNVIISMRVTNVTQYGCQRFSNFVTMVMMNQSGFIIKVLH